MDHYLLENRVSYSQGNEEAFILHHFRDKGVGRFLDIGAYNGHTFSNTMALAEQGWGGVCVEPSPHAFMYLHKHHGANPDIQLVCAAVHDHEETVAKFFVTPDAISSLNADHRTRWESKPGVDKFSEIYVHVMSVEQLFKAFPGPYDFITIDAEGVSCAITRALFKHCQTFHWFPSLMCIEHDEDPGLMQEAKALGYRMIHKDCNNMILEKA